MGVIFCYQGVASTKTLTFAIQDFADWLWHNSENSSRTDGWERCLRILYCVWWLWSLSLKTVTSVLRMNKVVAVRRQIWQGGILVIYEG